MFSRHNSQGSHSVSDMKPPSPLGQKQNSHDGSSVLSRTNTATSVSSASSINHTFETHWMPSSSIVSKKTYNVNLRLKPKEIELLRKSWTIVTAQDAKASRRDDSVSITSNGSGGINNFNTASFSSFLFCIQFYNNFMDLNPEIERLIPSIRHQASAFAGVLAAAIATLEDLSKMKESLANLGRLHARILGIDPNYFKIMGDALIKTFQDWFGNNPEQFPIELEEAWIKLYCFLANSIIQGGIDPEIEYNNSRVAQSLELNEADEDETDQYSFMYSEASATKISMVDEALKSSNYKANSTKLPSASVTSSAYSKGYSNIATKSYSKFKKNKNTTPGDKDGDCTIM
ncbi:hypothetical protein DAMA08_035090 [Martiniozyma asiatica (nom. inval.)]|nr:hypothetical protein DAMA08_035090 [Martiniozyma asiatica]